MYPIKRFNFKMDDFTRYSWVSDEAKLVWETRIQKIQNAWLEIEWLSVAEGLRQCTLRIISPEDLVDLTSKMANHGLSVLPLSMIAKSSQPYSNTASAYQSEGSFNYQIVIGKLESLNAFKSAYDVNNEIKIGQLLGYPNCCSAFFQKIWVEEQFIDTTYPMAANTILPTNNEAMIEVEGPLENNTLLRWLGIRAVPHLPCSFNCQHTTKKAQQYINLGIKAGYIEEMSWLTEMLSWPVEWSALHGIAEIKTPIVRISSATDATNTKYTVCWKGKSYPDQGAHGNGFPYQQGIDSSCTITFKNIKNKQKQIIFPAWYYLDNGFLSKSTMNFSHDPVVKLVSSTLCGSAGSILDLGCGNGVLLKKIIDNNKLLIPYGIEKDFEKIMHANQVIPTYYTNLVTGDIFETEKIWTNKKRYSLIILMPGRLLEASPEQVKWLKQKIKQSSANLLVYAYGDWLAKYNGLFSLCEQVGLLVQNTQRNASCSLAKIIS